MFEKLVVIDCKGHIYGRLAAIVAKELLKGQRVVCVRTEELNISGTLGRNYMLWEHYLNKRMNTNKARGPQYYRAPSRIFWRSVRSMMPYKTRHGAISLMRLRVHEGIPHPYDKIKRKVCPAALTNLRLKPDRKFCRLGDLAQRLGWRHNELVKRLEAKRTAKATAFHTTKTAVAKVKAQATQKAESQLKAINAELAKYGY